MTPDARLSAAERAALAHLEAAAAAEDPRLASRLRGTPVARIQRLALGFVPLLNTYVFGRLAKLPSAGWWGIPVLVVGFCLMIVGLTSGLVLAVAGAFLATVGLRMLAGLIETRARRRSP